MSLAENNESRAVEVNRGAGFQYAYSLQFVTATLATYTLADNDQRLVEYNCTGGAGTIYLPAQPDPWMEFEFVEVAGVATALTIDGNGKTIDGGGSLLLNGAYRRRKVRYNGTEWNVVGAVN